MGRGAPFANVQKRTLQNRDGGSYHEWDSGAGAWVRKTSVLCDSATGNIGWNMTDTRNAGKTEAQLRARDKSSYSAGRKSGAAWRYLGVCYADRVLP